MYLWLGNGCKKHSQAREYYNHQIRDMAASKIYTRQLAGKAELKSSLTEVFRDRLFNSESFVYTHLMNQDPKDLLPSLRPITDIMAIKIALKESLMADNICFDEFKEDFDLLALERSSAVEISSFDFADYRLHRLTELSKDWTASLYYGLGPYNLTKAHRRRFLKFIERVRRESFEDTRFAYDDFLID